VEEITSSGTIPREEVFKVEALTPQEFIETHAIGLTRCAVSYLVRQNTVDWTRIGQNNYLIVMTPKTLSYVPNRFKRKPQKAKTALGKEAELNRDE
jgi:hypothetical protein